MPLTIKLKLASLVGVVLGFFVAGLAVTGLGLAADATTSAPGQPRSYEPAASTIVEIEGDRYDGWTVTYYDRSTREYAGEEAARKRCTRFARAFKTVRCSAIVNQRGRDFTVMQQGLAYAHALAED